MADALLLKLLEAVAADEDWVTPLNALADLMLDVSPAGRVEALARLAGEARLWREYRGSLDRLLLPRKGAGVLGLIERIVPRRDPGREPLVWERMRAASFRSLGEAIEEARWYAVRVERSRNDNPHASEAWTFAPEEVLLRLLIHVSPLDGGKVARPPGLVEGERLPGG